VVWPTLTCEEIGDDFHIEQALQYGMVPKIHTFLDSKEHELAISHLKSYVIIYKKEEIQAEALTRNIGSFQIRQCADFEGDFQSF
jgi:hypothetical protein